jgi:hypothetical protein
MKKILFWLCLVCTLALVIGCSTPAKVADEAKEDMADQALVKRPDILDHKNYKWGKDVPDWVFLDNMQLEEVGDFKDFYMFKFESPRAQDLQGAELWTKNFTAAAEIAQTVKNRVQVKFAGAAAGDMDMLETYMEQTVKSLADATYTGFTKVDDYWVQMRYYKPDGDVDEDAFTYVILYKMPKDVLDELVQNSLENSEAVDKPKTEDEKTARNRVKEAFSDGL